MQRLSWIVFAFVTLSAAWPPGERLPVQVEQREGLWVYENWVASAAQRQRLLRDAERRGVNTLYMNVYRPTPNLHRRRLYDEYALARFIRQAHRRGIEVWAAYGAVTWHRLGAGPGSPPHRRMEEIAAYNRAHPRAPFDGVMLDIEPPEPVDLQNLLHLYEDLLGVLEPAGIEAAAAVRFFWDDAVAFPERGGPVKAAHEHVLDQGFDHVVVMAYRNYARDARRRDGIIPLSQAEMGYAHRQGHRRKVVVGLRNTSTTADGGPPKTTFFHMDRREREREKRRVAEHFAPYHSFGGFAMHRYEREQP